MCFWLVMLCLGFSVVSVSVSSSADRECLASALDSIVARPTLMSALGFIQLRSFEVYYPRTCEPKIPKRTKNVFIFYDVASRGSFFTTKPETGNLPKSS